MYQVLTKNQKNICRILSKACTISAAMCIIFSSGGCGNIRSVHSKNAAPKYAKNSVVKSSKTDNKQNIAEIEEFIKKTENAKNSADEDNVSEVKNHSEKKLLTLREQMQVLAKDQEQIKADVGTLQNDVSEIKLSLNEIKSAVVAQNAIDAIIPEKNQGAVKGEFSDFESEEEYLNSDYNDDVIVSDEEADVQVKPQPKPVVKKKTVKKAKKTPSVAVAPKVQKKTETKAAIQQNNYQMASQPKVTEQEVKTQTVAKANDHLKQALNTFSKRDYKKAINSFNTVLTTEKDPETVAVCSYWLGESYFRLGQYQNAVKCFNQSLSHGSSSKTEEAKFMIGESHLRMGKVSEAKQSFERFMVEYPRSRYIARAKKLLQQI